MAERNPLTNLRNMGSRPRGAEKPAEGVEAVPAGEGRPSGQSGSRAGKTHVGAYFPPEVRQQLRQIALDQDKTLQSLMGEAVNHLFAAYGKPEIAPTDDGR